MNDFNEELSQKIVELDWNIEPSKDLWSGIENKLDDKKANVATSNVIRVNFSWKNYALVASVLIGFVAVVFSALSLKAVTEIDQRHTAYVEHQIEQIQLMEQQHLLVRAQLVRMIHEEKDHLGVALISDINASLLVIDKAATELKAGIMQSATNASYTSMLANTYLQEAEMLEILNSSRSTKI